MISLDPIYLNSIVRMALAEDVGSGDITTMLTVPDDVTPEHEAKARVVAKEEGVIAGIEVAAAVFSMLETDDIDIMTSVLPWRPKDGARVPAGHILLEITGQPRTILTGERVALNFLQRMSGIATLTAKYVEQVSHTKAKIVDTRKTSPGLRRLEKYAVTVGGGHNHRFGLYDGILIKDNHIAACGGVGRAVELAKKGAPHTLKVEVEVTTLAQLEEAIRAHADAVLLDNMPIDKLREAVEVAEGRVFLEASGGVNLDTVAAVAETGVDIISVGELTHSPKALDISLEFVT